MITHRLKLRRFTSADAENIYHLDNDAEVMRYNNGGIKTARSIIENKILPTMTTADEEKSCLGFWAVENLINDEFMGWASLRFVSDVIDPETIPFATIGYRFNKRWWGQGFATEAMTKLLDCGFAEACVEQVEATTYEENLGSIGVMLKLGMHFTNKFRYTEEKLLDSDTTHVDVAEIWDGFDVRYTLTKNEWREHRIKQ
jgi:RimJ/RimL family protein N-acetyltransferase